jgi:hypothetical protein
MQQKMPQQEICTWSLWSVGLSHGKVWQEGPFVSEKHTDSIFSVEAKMKAVVLYNLGNPYQT